MTLKRTLPTVFQFLERRQKAARNRLPSHLRPPARWPIVVQIILNVAIIGTLIALISNIDDFVTDAVPAVVMIVCLLFLIYTIISGMRLRAKFLKRDGHRLAQVNFWMVIAALVLWPATVAFFLR